MTRRQKILFVVLAVCLLALPFRGQIRAVVAAAKTRATVAARVATYGPAARKRLQPDFRRADVAYPPRRLVLLGLKEEKEVQLYAADKKSGLRFIRRYPILAASGKLGPKLKEGDCQVPEGLYRVTFLNPNSSYHLSLRLNYPNDFDRAMAKKDRRTQLGGDIMIHGSNVSIGCLAMGDAAAEDLFVLAADTGIARIQVILAPCDLRAKARPARTKGMPVWVDTLYDKIAPALKALPSPPKSK